MKREHIIDVLQQLQTILAQLGDMQKNLNQGRAVKEILQDRGEHERVLQVAKELQTIENQYERAKQTLFRRCKRQDVLACEQLVIDCSERVKLADAAYEVWRNLAAQHELESRLPSDTPEERAQRELRISALQERYETALAMAEDAIPTPGVVML